MVFYNDFYLYLITNIEVNQKKMKQMVMNSTQELVLDTYEKKNYDVSYLRANPKIRARNMYIYCLWMEDQGITPESLKERGVDPSKFYSEKHPEEIIARLGQCFRDGKDISNMVDLDIEKDAYEIALEMVLKGFDFGDFFHRCGMSFSNIHFLETLYDKKKANPEILEYINDDQSDDRVRLILDALSDNLSFEQIGRISNILYHDVQAKVIYNLYKTGIPLGKFESLYINSSYLIHEYDEFRKANPDYNLPVVGYPNIFGGFNPFKAMF